MGETRIMQIVGPGFAQLSKMPSFSPTKPSAHLYRDEFFKAFGHLYKLRHFARLALSGPACVAGTSK